MGAHNILDLCYRGLSGWCGYSSVKSGQSAVNGLGGRASPRAQILGERGMKSGLPPSLGFGEAGARTLALARVFAQSVTSTATGCRGTVRGVKLLGPGRW